MHCTPCWTSLSIQVEKEKRKKKSSYFGTCYNMFLTTVLPVTILEDSQEVIHIVQMPLLLQRAFDRNLHLILGLLLERLAEEGKWGLVVRPPAVALGLVPEDFGQGLLQEDYLVTCLEIEGIAHVFEQCKHQKDSNGWSFPSLRNARTSHNYRSDRNDYSDNSFWGGTSRRSSGSSPSTGTRTASGFGGTTRRWIQGLNSHFS